jgi:ribonuclease HII
MTMLLHKNPANKMEAGVDEAGRGCLAGRVYVAAVILPESLPADEQNKWKWIRDSKKLSPKRREEMRQYIQMRAVAWAVESADPAEILEKNILGATMAAMNRAICKLNPAPDFLLIDGNHFRRDQSMTIPHECIEGGDATYMSIAAASILAKTYHDDHVREMLHDNPAWAVYGWERNMCYGTPTHLRAIKEHGITPAHRAGFGICRNYAKSTLDFVDESESTSETSQ